MENITDMSTYFSQTINPILNMYNAAMNATTSRLTIIKDEFEFRTLAMDLWASLEHNIKYKSIDKESPIDFTAKLYECSNLTYKVEAEMEKMLEILEE